MNPLVEQMLNTTVSNDVETRLLEDLFEQEAKCEAQNHGELECTGEVTHVFKCCGYGQLICDSRVKYLEGHYRGKVRCTHCHEKCWTIRPI
jgi:hypothetical protein